LLYECTSLTVFPKSGNTQQVNYALKTYWGYTAKQIREFLDTKSRWVTFTKEYPSVIFTKYEIYIP
jgi:hypothetical protein